MLTKKQKQKVIEDLADKFGRQKIAIFSDFRGVSVAQTQTLRRLLKKMGAEYKVAKKTLLDRVLEKTGVGLRTKELEGEISVTFGYGDEIEPARTLLKFSKANETFKILGGILGLKTLTTQQVFTLARLPSREILLSQLLGALTSPVQGLVTVLGGNLRNLMVVLNKIKEQK